MPALACVGYRRPAALSKLAIANPKVDSIHPLLFMFGSQRPASKPFLTQRVRPAAQTPTRGLRKDHPCAGRGSPSGGMEELPFWIWLCSFPAAALRLPAGISSASAARAPSDARRAARLRAASPRFLFAVRSGRVPRGSRGLGGARSRDAHGRRFNASQTTGDVGRPMSQWPESAELQRRFFNRASDAYYVEVLKVSRLQGPRFFFTQHDFHQNRIVNIQLRSTSMLFLPCGLDGRELLNVGGGAPGCEAQRLAGWPLLTGTTAALQAVQPFATMVVTHAL